MGEIPLASNTPPSLFHNHSNRHCQSKRTVLTVRVGRAGRGDASLSQTNQPVPAFQWRCPSNCTGWKQGRDEVGIRRWRWHLDEVFVKINGERHCLWRAVDHVGEVQESYVTKKRGKAAALAFLKKAPRRRGWAEVIVTDGLRSYLAAMRVLGNLDRREMGRRKNNRVENSHLPFRRRERAMQRFRRMKSLQKFASVHASMHDHFNQERHRIDRQTYKIRLSAALAEWQSRAA